MNFSIPEYCTKKLAAARVKKFTLCRTPANLNQRGRYWVSVAYELPRPQTVDSSNRNTAYLSLGASSLGVYVPFDGESGYEEVVDLWRPDKYWLPRIEAVTKARDARTRTKGSRTWGKRDTARRRMYELMARQQTQDVREIVAYLLWQGFRHFVIQDYVVRSKQGKLADSQKSDRGGGLGLNWSAQNTGSISRLARWLEDKVIEYGGTVTRHRPTTPAPKGLRGRANKLPMARRLCESLMVTRTLSR